MSTALHWAALIAYVAGALVSLAYLCKQRSGLYRMGMAILWVGFGLHTAALAAAWLHSGVLPAANLRQSLDIFSWAIMGAALVVNLRLEVKILGALAGPLCAVMLMAAAVLPRVEGVSSAAFKSLWIIGHVVSIMAGYGLLALTCLGGVLYLVQDRALRAKKMGPVFERLPSLGRLDSLSHQSLVAGFLLMTVGLITGAVYAQMTLGSFWRLGPQGGLGPDHLAVVRRPAAHPPGTGLAGPPGGLAGGGGLRGIVVHLPGGRAPVPQLS